MALMAEPFIRGSAADPGVAARRRVLERGDDLLAEVSAKVAVVTELHVTLIDREAVQGRVVQFCTEQLLPRLNATDRALYSLAENDEATRLLVEALRCHHRAIADHVAALDRAENQDAETAAAQAIVAVLQACVAVEHEVLLPALSELPRIDWPNVVENMALLSEGGAQEVPDALDVREIPHARRHPTVFAVYARLGHGESFVLVNDHDPKPLRDQLQAAFPAELSWDYLESGPDLWRVSITRHTVN